MDIKINYFKYLYLVLLIVIVLNFNTITINAFEFDNVKSIKSVNVNQDINIGEKNIEYNPLWLKYPPIEIINNYGNGEILFKGVLKSHDLTCGENCKSTIEVYLANDDVLIQDVEFYKIYSSKARIKTTIKDYKFYIKIGETLTGNDIITYEYVCDNVMMNGSLIDCHNKKILTPEIKDLWKEYKIGEKIKAGNYLIKIEGEKDYFDTIDWVIKTNGKVLDEWADWGAGGTITYYGSYVIHTYLVNGTFNVSTSNNVDVLIIGGGGAGGTAPSSIAGGGGAGGIVLKYNHSLAAGSYNVVVGRGGFGSVQGINVNGSNSSFDGLVAVGGGGGASSDGNPWRGSAGGSSGGSAQSPVNGWTASIQPCYSGATCYGTNGGNSTTSGGAGGGGGLKPGYNVTVLNAGANGGEGISINMNGTNVTYAGGGGGGGATKGIGGSYIGGNGTAPYGGGTALSGLNGTGSGGGGGCGSSGGIGGNGIVIIRYINPVSLIIVNQGNPQDNFFTNDTNVSFYCNATSTTGVYNLSLSIPYPYINRTVYNTTTQNLSLILNYSYIFPQGVYTWACIGSDSQGTGFTSSRTFTVDYTAPNVTFFTPAQNQEFLTKKGSLNITFAGNATDNIGLSTCSYYQPFTETFITCGQNFSYNLSKYDSVDNIITFFSNDTRGNYATTSREVYINIVNDSMNQLSNSPSYSLSTIYLYLNASNLSNVYANVTYNGTRYTLSEISNDGQRGIYSTSVISPNVSGDSIIYYYSNYSINGNKEGTNIYNQNIYVIQNINITDKPCYPLSLNYTLKDSSNLSILHDGIFEYNIRYYLNNASNYTLNGKITNSSNLYVCINQTISTEWFIDYGEILYYTLSGGYEQRRQYIYKNTTLTNSTQLKTLYTNQNLQSFVFTVQDVGLNPYVNYYLNLLRWYPDLNSYELVEMGKTDDNGETILKLTLEDVDYRLGVYDVFGDLVELKNPSRFSCPVAPCTADIKVLGIQDFTELFNIQLSLTFDDTLNIFTLIYNDPSSNSDLINLTIYKVTSLDEYPVCSSSSISNIGVLNCNVTGQTGTLKAAVFRSASPETPIKTLFVDISIIVADLDDSIKTFIGFIILALLGLIGAFMGPVASIILLCVGAVSLIYLNILNWYIAGAIILIGLVIYTTLKKVI